MSRVRHLTTALFVVLLSSAARAESIWGWHEEECDPSKMVALTDRTIAVAAPDRVVQVRIDSRPICDRATATNVLWRAVFTRTLPIVCSMG